MEGLRPFVAPIGTHGVGWPSIAVWGGRSPRDDDHPSEAGRRYFFFADFLAGLSAFLALADDLADRAGAAFLVAG